MLREFAGAVLLRLKQAANEHEAKLAKMRCAGHVRLGSNSSIDYRKISPKQGAMLNIGVDSMFAGCCIFDRPNAIVNIGSRTYVGGTINCAERITIDDDVLISSGGNISDHNSHALNFADRRTDVVEYIAGRKDWSNVPISAVTIEACSWIGVNVIILKGVTIGEGAVVGAGSVVTKNVPPYTVVVGNPARVIRELSRPKSVNN